MSIYANLAVLWILYGHQGHFDRNLKTRKANKIKPAPLAHSVEQGPLKAKGEGSIPSRCTCVMVLDSGLFPPTWPESLQRMAI